MCALPLCAAEPDAAFDQWIAAQSRVHSWSADFTQTRALAALTQPLVTPGRVWFAAPDRFRWELGNPAQTIAVCRSNEVALVYPLLKRIEKYPMAGGGNAPWRDALALLDAGFPRSRAEYDSRFRLLTARRTNAGEQFTLEPRSSTARRLLAEIEIGVHTNDLSLAFTQVRITDGSTLRNDFTNARVNVPVDDGLFEAPTQADYTVVTPAAP